MSDSPPAFQPRPCRMLLDYNAQRGSRIGFVGCRSGVRALENPWRADRIPLRNHFQQSVGFFYSAGAASDGPPLENCTQSLAVGDTGSLRFLKQLIEQPEVVPGLVGCRGEPF